MARISGFRNVLFAHSFVTLRSGCGKKRLCTGKSAGVQALSGASFVAHGEC